VLVNVVSLFEVTGDIASRNYTASGLEAFAGAIRVILFDDSQV
jgi:hypothetical protein